MRAKKSLGQHFLASPAALSKIVEAANISSNDVVLEIGPGKGVLTEKLLERAKNVIAIEKDRELISYLKEKFSKEINNGTLSLVHEDILNFDPSSSLLSPNPYLLVANIPYYITGAILEKFLASKHQPSRMVLLVQKEVAERIARDKKESLLSISVKAYGTPRYVATIKKGSFSPPPKVDSAILSVDGISKKNFFDKSEEGKFFSIVKAGFAHKRKLLAGNLTKVATKEKVREAFATCSLDEQTRAESLDIEMWKCLTKHL